MRKCKKEVEGFRFCAAASLLLPVRCVRPAAVWRSPSQCSCRCAPDSRTDIIQRAGSAKKMAESWSITGRLRVPLHSPYMLHMQRHALMMVSTGHAGNAKAPTPSWSTTPSQILDQLGVASVPNLLDV